MIKEVLIYGEITSWGVSYLIESINAILNEDENAELCVRVNSNGGDLDYGWGAVTKFAEYPNKKLVKVDGKAQSMGFFFLVYADNVVATDYSSYLIHRAAYPQWIETNPDYFTEARKKSLADANKKLRAAMEAKCDAETFKKVTGHTYDELFSLEGRLDIILNAKQAKQLGFVNSIVTYTPQKKAQIEAQTLEMVAKHNGISIAAKTDNKPSKPNTMTLAELKAEHPALYAEIVESISKEVAKKERARIKAWMKFYDVDAKKVNEGIESGEELDMATAVDFMEARAAKKKVTETEEDSEEEEIVTPEPPSKKKDAKQAEIENWKKDVLENSTLLGKEPTKK